MWDWWQLNTFPPRGLDMACKSVYWSDENIEKLHLLNVLSRKVPGGQQKESWAFCPGDECSALTGHFSPPHTLPERHNLFPPEGGRRISAGDRFIGVHVKQNTSKSLLKASEIELPFISSWNPVKYFIRFISGSDWRPGSLDFVENNIYFQAPFKMTASLLPEVTRSL